MSEFSRSVTLETERGRQVESERDIAKKKSDSYSPKKRNQRIKGENSHSLERKIAALKDPEARSEIDLNKPLKAFAKEREEGQTGQKARSSRKPRKLSDCQKKKLSVKVQLIGRTERHNVTRNRQQTRRSRQIEVTENDQRHIPAE